MKVGDYVRTKGYITKIDSCTCWKAKNQWYISYKLPNGSDCASAVTDEFKISPNIIDLIEVGDYVNGCRIQELVTGLNGEIYLETELTEFDNVYACGNINIYEKDIKSIVTKEMYSSVEYRVEIN